MALKNLLTALTIVAALTSCNNNNTESTQNISPPTDQVPHCKTLLVVGDDRSGSASEIRRLEIDDYKQMMTTICEKGGGAFASVIIGNPDPQNKQTFRKTFDLQKQHKEKIKGATLSQDEQVNNENKKIDAENQQLLAANAAKCEDFCNIINANVINYKPANKDLTDINDALAHINTLINEPTYSDYDNIVVTLFCDGVNQPKSSKVEPITVKLESQKSFTLYLIGWKDRSIFDYIPNKAFFDSKDGLIETLKKLSCN